MKQITFKFAFKNSCSVSLDLEICRRFPHRWTGDRESTFCKNCSCVQTDVVVVALM